MTSGIGFIPGDRVEVINGADVGKVGTVTESLGVKLDGGGTNLYAATSLAHRQEPAGPTAPQVNDPALGWIGVVGGPNANWRQLITPAKKHPESAAYVNAFYNKGPDRPGNFNGQALEYTYACYDGRPRSAKIPKGATTTVTVKGSGALVGQKIPWAPDWFPASGSDGQIIILNPETGEEYDLWQVRNITSTSVTISNGSKLGQGTNGGDPNYHTRESGWRSSRGVGIHYLAMLVTGAEARAASQGKGKINHALSMPVQTPRGDYAFHPATKVEHPSNGSGSGIPEGLKIGLNVTPEQILAWAQKVYAGNVPAQKFAIELADAWRRFGTIVTDTAGAAYTQVEFINTSKDDLVAAGLFNANGSERTRADGKRALSDIWDGLVTQGNLYACPETGPRIKP